MFGTEAVAREIQRMQDLAFGVGYKRAASHSLPGPLARLLKLAGRCELEALSAENIESAHAAEPYRSVRQAYWRIASVLRACAMLERPLSRP